MLVEYSHPAYLLLTEAKSVFIEKEGHVLGFVAI
jgi:hypothetical protein